MNREKAASAGPTRLADAAATGWRRRQRALLVAAVWLAAAASLVPAGCLPAPGGGGMAAAAALSGPGGVYLPYADAGRRGVGPPAPATRDALWRTSTAAAATRTAWSAGTPGPTASPTASPTGGGTASPTAGPTASSTASHTASAPPPPTAEGTAGATQTQAPPEAEHLRPSGAGRAGHVDATYDAARGMIRLSLAGEPQVSYEIDLTHPDLQHGRLSVLETTSGRLPVSGAGFYYRSLDGQLAEPWLTGRLGHVDAVTPTMLADGVRLLVHETLESRPHLRAFTVRLHGCSLEVHAESLDGPGQADGSYAGFSVGDVVGTADGLNVPVPYMEAVPVTMLDHRWFVSALVDYPQSQASQLTRRGPEALADGFTNEVAAVYLPDASGAVRPVDETVWVTVSPDVADTFPIPSRGPSPHRAALDTAVHLTLAGHAPFGDQAAALQRLRTFGVSDLAIHEEDWSDPARPAPHPGVPDPARGGADGWQALVAASGGRLAAAESFTTTVTGCPAAPDPLYRPEDRVTGADGQAKRLALDAGGVRDCPGGGQSVRYLLAPDAARRVALDAGLRPAGVGGTHLLDLAAWNPAFGWPGAQENVLDRAAPPAHAATIAQAIAEYKRLFADLQASVGPTYADGASGRGPAAYDSFYAGYVDAVGRSLAGSSAGEDSLLLAPDYEMAVVRPRAVAYGMGTYAAFLEASGGGDPPHAPLSDAEIDRWRAANLAFGHAGSWTSGGAPGGGDWLTLAEQVKEYLVMRAVGRRYLGSQAARVTYVTPAGSGDLSWALRQEVDLASPRLHLTYDRLDLWVNFAADPWDLTVDGWSYSLPTYGWLAVGSDKFLAYSALVDGQHVDLVSAPELTLIDGRGTRWSAAGLVGQDLVVRLADGTRFEEIAGGELVVAP